MSERQEGNFLDPKTIFAIVLVGVVFYGWQSYLGQKYPDYYKKKPAVEQPVATTTGANTAAKTEAPKPSETADLTKPEPPKVAPAETLQHYENEIFSVEISSQGMGLRNLTLKEYTDRHKNPIRFGDQETGSLFRTELENGQIPHFTMTKVNDHTFQGEANVDGTQLQKTITIDGGTGKIEATLVVQKAGPQFKGFNTILSESRVDSKASSMFMPSVDHQEFVVRHDGKTERVRADKQDEDLSKSFDPISMAAISSQYFTMAVVDHSNIMPSVDFVAPKLHALIARLKYRPQTVSDNMEFKYVAYAGGKSVPRLESIDPELSEVVNLGIFASIGRILMKILNWSHAVVGNWGWAIIVLTLMVRALVMPFNIASYRSMKKMQQIQPHLQSLRERYKDDPAALNRESMALMKTHKVNPLGGCLPMLLQMPIFFALYQVLGQSIELYQAPFTLWIHDLSLKDPYYILPVLMGAVMFIQQKLTPNPSMDPNQAKILQFMPIIFSVFTLGLPSGLTLYIFVSTLFSVTQQKLFMRDKTKAPTVVDVKAQRVH